MAHDLITVGVNTDLIAVGVNTAVILVSAFLLIISLKNKKVLTSAGAWKRMVSYETYIQRIFLLFFISIIIYLVSETAELLSDLMVSPTLSLESLHHYGEEVHMFFALGALIITVQLLRKMLELDT